MTPREPVPIPPVQRRRQFRTETVPLLVWGAAALVVAFMLVERGMRFEHLGIAQAFRYEISVSIDGRVDEVLVVPLQAVREGEIIVRLDAEGATARLRAAEHALAQARAEAAAARAGLAGTGARAASLANDLRRFLAEEEQRRLDVHELQALVEGDEVALRRLELEAQRAVQLHEAGVIATSESDAARLLRDEAEARLVRNRSQLEAAVTELAASAERRRRFEASLGEPGADSPVEPLIEAVKLQQELLREVEAEVAALVVRAPVSGEVSQVLVMPGQAVTPGRTLAVIVPPETTEIVTYLEESEWGAVAPGMPVRLARRADPARVSESLIGRVGRSVELKPQQLWRDPRVPEYGKPVTIPVPPALGLTPGEGVVIRFDTHL